MMRNTFPKFIVTQEHGSWAVLLVPLLISGVRSGVWTLDSSLLLGAIICGFLAYVPAQILLRHVLDRPQNLDKLFSASSYGFVLSLVAVCLTFALVMRGHIFLLVISGFAVALFLGNFFLRRLSPKSILSDLIGIAGLTLGAPALRYVSTGTIDNEAVSLYLLSLLFFGCHVVYVHMKIRAVEMKREKFGWDEKFSLGSLNLLYHLAVISIVTIMAVIYWTPMMTAVAFLPITIHAMYGTYTLSSRVRFKRLGILLVAHSILFAVMLMARAGTK